MTIQGAINELINLLNADDIPIYYKGGIKKVIETIDDYIDGKDDYVKRKTNLKRGEWIAKTENYHSHWVCSECEAWALLEYNEQMCLSNFCPNCGADMREREGE